MYAADRSLTANAFLPSACASWAGVVSRTAVALVAAENLHAAAAAEEEEEEEEEAVNVLSSSKFTAAIFERS